MAQVELKQIENLNLEQLTVGGLTWINIQPPTERACEYLSQNYPFHPLDLDDVLSRIQRPKVDEYEDYMFFVFNFPRYYKREQVLSQSQVSAFIGQDYLITLHKGELKPLRRLFEECRDDEKARED